jgi:predicted secreted acid phosphatase
MGDYMKLIRDKVEDAIQIVYEYKSQYPDAENLGIVFDIDGTLLNEDTPIKPVVDFYNICKSLGYHLFIITARDSHGVAETIEQLEKLGIIDYVSIYFRLPVYWDMNHYKETCRESITNKGYKIVLSIGDTQWDVGKYGGYGILLPHLAF